MVVIRKLKSDIFSDYDLIFFEIGNYHKPLLVIHEHELEYELGKLGYKLIKESDKDGLQET